MKVRYLIFWSSSAAICCMLFLSGSCSSKNPEANDDPEHEEVTQQVDTIKPDFSELDRIDFLMGKFDPAGHPDFVIIDKKYADREGMYLQRGAYEAFKKMYDAALKDSIKLQIRSATRNFDYQKGIWERKWTGMTLLEDKHNASEKFPEPVERAKQILRYSSMPGSSRHHWGTDIDLNAFNNEWFERGEGLKLYNWLEKNASTYGFCQPYSAKDESGRKGYEEEKWHWSYLPLANTYLTASRELLHSTLIQGFLGSETSEEVKIHEEYILGINPECMP